ncbi:hypothetical protein A464_1236 [Salmonella bongori N268-08]|uniref:Uncharacterized protein n=1 Tax=Salmonella bongori N268-08 TaxID=1197719 RepID=S5NDS2_SALBN|nr:hypothetical protein A464_1236 [Salmonella bongori N268-08]
MAGLYLTAMSRPGKHNASAIKVPDDGYILSGLPIIAAFLMSQSAGE